MGTDATSRAGPDDSGRRATHRDGMGKRWRRWIVPVLTTCVFACSTGGDASSDGSGASGDLELTEVSPEVVERLAEAGIAVHADDGSGPLVEVAGPVSPVQLQAWQARNLELEWRAGSGLDPELLDAALTEGAAPPDGVTATPSDLILGWAQELDTPAAAYAREVLAGDGADEDGDQAPGGDEAGEPGQGDDADPAGRPIPHLALVLFASDVATAAAELPEPTEPLAPDGDGDVGADAGGPPGLRRQGTDHAAPPSPVQNRTGPCSSVIDGIDRVVAAVFDAVGRLAQPPAIRTGFGLFDQLVNGLARIIVGGINVVVDGIHFVVENGVRIVIGEVMRYVARIAGIAATISQVVSLVRPWALRVETDPLVVEAPRSGVATARIELGGLDEWPAWATDCAERAGVTLPPLRPQGNPVTWVVAPDPRIASGQIDTQLQEGGTASYRFTVIADPPGRGRLTEVDDVPARVTVQRDDTTELHDAITDLVRRELERLLPPVGTLVSNLVLPVVRPWIDQALDVLAHLRDVSSRALLVIRYGVPDPDQPPPGSDEGAGSGGSGPSGSGQWTGDVCALVPDGEVNEALDIQINWVPPQNPGWCVKYMNGGTLGLTDAVWLSVGVEPGEGPRRVIEDPESFNSRAVDGLDCCRAVWSNLNLGFHFEHDGVVWSVGVYRSGTSGILEDHLAIARIVIEHLEDG